jgi:hypothetical protein
MFALFNQYLYKKCIMISQPRQLHSINDFPKVGLIYYENSGENLLKFYLEKIYKIEIKNNIIKSPDHTDNIDNLWITSSDYPMRNNSEYNEAHISSAILLIRNPVDVIMSRVLKDSFYLEEAFNKIDEYIQQWKDFYKYWFNSPIPVYIVRYEDLITSPYDILLDLCKFLLGLKTIENTKLDYFIKISLKDQPSKTLYAYDIEFTAMTDNHLISANLESIQDKFIAQLNKLMIKLNYEVGPDNIADWLNEFNIENLVKSIEFHEQIVKESLTSSYFTMKIG